MTKDELIARLLSLRPALEAEGVCHVALFGSRARGDNTDGSDVDILLDVAPSARFSLLNLVGVEQIVQDGTGIQAHAVMRRGLDDELRDTIRKDLVDVF